MDNRVVALSVLEDLLHWPVLPCDGYISGRAAAGDEEEEEDNDEEGANLLSAGAAEDNDSEPRTRKYSRYRAVLQLPCLCLKLGRRWAEAEVVPYLLRCAEEEDPQLSFVSGITMLGLALPRQVMEADRDRARKDAEVAAAAVKDKKTNGKAATAVSHAGGARDVLDGAPVTSYLSIEEMFPVIEALSASREECIRAFVAQVVIPHLLFGVSLERDTALQSWDHKYLPAHLFTPLDGAEDSDVDGADALAPSSDGVVAGCEAFLASRRGTRGNPLVDLSYLEEDVSFLFDEGYADLSGPFAQIELLARLAPFSQSHSSGGRGRGARHRASRCGEAAAASPLPLLRGAPLHLHGISYAADRRPARGGRIDFFTLNVQARTLVTDVTTWVGVLSLPRGSAAAVAGETAAASGDGGAQREKPKATPRAVHVSDYLGSNTVYRDALKLRWRVGQKLLTRLLESTHPGACAVAVETISMLLHTVNWGQSYLDSLLAMYPEENRKNGASVGLWPSSAMTLVVGEPPQSLCSVAELEMFRYSTTRRHIAFALAAGASTRRLSSTHLSAAQLVTSVTPALDTAKEVLLALLYDHHLLAQVPLAPGPDDTTHPARTVLQVGAGPPGARLPLLSTWDVCFASTQSGGKPDDVQHLMISRREGGSVSPTSEAIAPLICGSTNAASAFRMHRTLRLTLLRMLPLLLDLPRLYHVGIEETAAVARCADLSTVCRVLVQMLVPASALLRLLPEASTCASPRTSSFARCEETPASLDFGLTSVILGAVHRIFADVARATPQLLTAQAAALLPSKRTSGRASRADGDDAAAVALVLDRVSAVCDQLFHLLQSCLRYIAIYSAWKCRWLLAKRLPALTAALWLVLLRIQHVANSLPCATATAGNEAAVVARLREGLSAASSSYYYRICRALAEAWGAPQSEGAASHPLSSWVSEEDELEVRCLALPCAAGLFSTAVQTALRLGAEKAASGAQPLATGLAPFLQPLVPLMDAVLRCCTYGLKDTHPRVRCAAARALSHLSGTTSTLIAATSVSSVGPVTGHSGGTARLNGGSGSVLSSHSAAQPGTWRMFLSSITSSLLTLMDDGSSTVQMTLVSKLTDLLVATPLVSRCPGRGDGGRGEEAGFVEESAADAARHDALLTSLRSLASHDIWRFRAQYAVLLCDMCLRFLCPHRPWCRPTRSKSGGFSLAGGQGLASPRDSNNSSGSSFRLVESIDDAEAGDAEAYYVALAHAQPLYRLARDELLPLLVCVLFDRVKAVRDVALHATVQMCAKLNSVQLTSSGAAATNAATATSTTTAPVSGGSSRGTGMRPGRTSSVISMDETGSHVEDAVGMGGRFISDVLWPLIQGYPAAWETYLSRSALLCVAVRLSLDKETVLLPLLDQLAYDAVLNVRLVVAKTILQILLASTPTIASGSREVCLPAGAKAYDILMGKYVSGNAGGLPTGGGGGEGEGAVEGTLPPVMFTEAEKNGPVLGLLRRLLEDSSADVRNEAAKALKMEWATERPLAPVVGFPGGSTNRMDQKFSGSHDGGSTFQSVGSRPPSLKSLSERVDLLERYVHELLDFAEVMEQRGSAMRQRDNSAAAAEGAIRGNEEDQAIPNITDTFTAHSAQYIDAQIEKILSVAMSEQRSATLQLQEALKTCAEDICSVKQRAQQMAPAQVIHHAGEETATAVILRNVQDELARQRERIVASERHHKESLSALRKEQKAVLLDSMRLHQDALERMAGQCQRAHNQAGSTISSGQHRYDCHPRPRHSSPALHSSGTPGTADVVQLQKEVAAAVQRQSSAEAMLSDRVEAVTRALQQLEQNVLGMGPDRLPARSTSTYQRGWRDEGVDTSDEEVISAPMQQKIRSSVAEQMDLRLAEFAQQQRRQWRQLQDEQDALRDALRTIVLSPSAGTLQSLDDRVRVLREELQDVYLWILEQGKTTGLLAGDTGGRGGPF